MSTSHHKEKLQMTWYDACSCAHLAHPFYRNFGSHVHLWISYQRSPLPRETRNRKDKFYWLILNQATQKMDHLLSQSKRTKRYTKRFRFSSQKKYLYSLLKQLNLYFGKGKQHLLEGNHSNTDGHTQTHAHRKKKKKKGKSWKVQTKRTVIICN